MPIKMRDDDAEHLLESLEIAQDALGEIVSETSARDGIDYSSLLKVHVRAADRLIYLALTWHGTTPPPGSAVYAPPGFWISRWYKTIDRNGVAVWDACLEANE